jgi:hypothetical protein
MTIELTKICNATIRPVRFESDGFTEFTTICKNLQQFVKIYNNL